MGLFDDIKKQNTRTYQEIILEICRLKTNNFPIIYKMSDEEQRRSDRFRKQYKVKESSPVIGINPGSGKRWVNKKWPEHHAVSLIKQLLKQKYQVLLLGGSEERELNKRIKKKSGVNLIETGCEHTVREYASVVNLCDVLVTMDTFTLHLGLAMGKNVVALFGPTSVPEIEMYGKGEKLFPSTVCQCYYKRSCTAEEPCMETILPERVFSSVKRLLA
jgi:ADP-heptose:LPS heptosyltransferase